MPEETITLTPSVISSFKVARTFRDVSRPTTSVNFDDQGEYCVVASADDSIRLYDCLGGKHSKTVFSKRYGVHLARFTHHQNNILHSSTREEDAVRYLSLHDNKYIRFFRGHKRRVVALDMSPLDDQFLSGSIDGTVRLWDLRTPNCTGIVNTTGRPCVAFDPSGVIFATGLESATIRLYDLNNYDKGPFATFLTQEVLSKMPGYIPAEWTSIKFSQDGAFLLVTTTGDIHYVLDAFNGDIKHQLTGHHRLGIDGGEEAGFSPDGKTVYSGSHNGTICFWDLQNPTPNGRPAKVLQGHVAPVKVVGFNHKYAMMVSAGLNCEMAFWEPENRPAGFGERR
ncbi:hypothetical protein K7432_004513 [Basidiobolus ranarum]|uniref:WD40 repeat-like protein n=1 Tax=Basidiobolus ranarum TaxID=34480 RepID=A0ABR2W5F8_9FUNG